MLATTSSSSNLSAYSTTSSSSSLNQEADSSGVGRSFDPRVVGYPYRLNLYAIPPPYELTVEEFEEFALDRLVVLKAIETAQLRNAFRAGSVAGGGGGGAASGASLATSASTGASNIVVLGPSSSINPALLKHIKDHLPLGRNALLKTGDYRVKELLQKQFHAERKKDHISHFILRLAFCSTPDLRRWFTKFEVELFKLRLEQEPDEQDGKPKIFMMEGI